MSGVFGFIIMIVNFRSAAQRYFVTPLRSFFLMMASYQSKCIPTDVKLAPVSPASYIHEYEAGESGANFTSVSFQPIVE